MEISPNYRDDRPLDRSYTTSGRESRNTYSFVAEAGDDGARLSCRARNAHSAAPKSADIVLAVQCERSRRGGKKNDKSSPRFNDREYLPRVGCNR